jgi:membrane peptidoglycan carboxypeptidase
MKHRPGLPHRRATWLISLIVLAPVFGLAVLFLVAGSRAPSTADLPVRTRAFDRQHAVTPVHLSQISPFVRESAVATEDERFYRHSGVDVIALLRAVPYDLTHFSLAQGASTIAEQLAKILYLRGTDHSLLGKAEEIVLGYRLGHRYGHEAVLDAYLNSVYLGEGEYGIQNASRHYFGRNAGQLSLSEASLLVGLIQAPSLYDPRTNPNDARARQIAVLRSMVRNGSTTQDEAAAAVAQPLRLAFGSSLPPVSAASFAVGAPFDPLELAAALVMLLLAAVALALTRAANPMIASRMLRAATVALIILGALTAAHSVRVL